MDDETLLDTRVVSRAVWNIPEAALIGLSGIGLLLLLSMVSWHLARQFGLTHWLSRFQLRELTTLFSLIVIMTTLSPVVALIAKKRQFGSFWQSIEWSGGRYFWGSGLLGAILGIVWSFSLGRLYGTAGYLRGSALNVILYIFSDAIMTPLVEEVYFRGILFVALLRRLGPLRAVAIVTIIFDMAHLGQWVYVLPVAILLGAVRLHTKSVASCFVLHVSYNLFMLLYLLVVTK